MSEGLQVTFTLRLGDGTHIEEASFSAQAEAVASALASDIEPYGRLLVRGGAQPELRFPDDLLPMADTVVGVLPDLRAGHDVAIAAYSQPCELRFAHAHGRLRTSAGDGPGREDDAAALVAALGACAARLVALLQSGRLRRPEAAAVLAKLAQVVSEPQGGGF